MFAAIVEPQTPGRFLNEAFMDTIGIFRWQNVRYVCISMLRKIREYPVPIEG